MLQVSIVLGLSSVILKKIAKIDKIDARGTLLCAKIAEVGFFITGCIALL